MAATWSSQLRGGPRTPMPPAPISSCSAGPRARTDSDTQTEPAPGRKPNGAAAGSPHSPPPAAAAGMDAAEPAGSGGEPDADAGPAAVGGGGSWLLSRVPILGALVHHRCTDKATQTHRDPVQAEAEKLALDTVYFAIGKHREPTGDRVCQTLRRCVDEILVKHRLLFTGMVTRLSIREETGYQTFVGVADELFERGHVTWARIVTFYAFGARLALYCQEQGMDDFVSEIARFIGLYASEHLAGFVRQEGGWAVLCDHFRYPEDMESKVWSALVKLGLGLGIAATASLISSR
ncbi:Bcl-2-like protein 1 [Amphibalanus amphitrite]|uniref:Bcl-2-like protein 1 n=2 Tax=Amphibalanus amphitrite TaxID=1232801 RepID=A0A6A4W7J9_AMPAM|nr:Bcl-2-like protein 1 [Amphibalanus amphitrite]